MKFIIIGLGHFGADLAKSLTSLGHEVIGVDNSMARVEENKDTITTTICLDSTNPVSMSRLPINNTDVVVICIGDNQGQNIMTTALVKKMKAKRVISRSISALHENVLEAMGVDEIIRPEAEAAVRWSLKLSSQNYLNLYEITKDYRIVELIVPKKLVNKSIGEIGLNIKYNLLILTKLKFVEKKNLLGKPTKVLKVGNIVNADTILNDGDIIVLYGNKNDIKRLMDENL